MRRRERERGVPEDGSEAVHNASITNHIRGMLKLKPGPQDLVGIGSYGGNNLG